MGRLNISQPGAIAGFTEAAQTLASGYSRAITADGVVDPLAGRFHTTASEIRSRISSTPIPSSPIVSVFATGSSQKDAVTLANAASDALVAFLVRSNQDNPDARRLLSQLRAAGLSYQRALSARQASNLQPPLNARGQGLAAAVETARIQLSSFEGAYQSTVGSQAISSLLQPLARAHSAASNRSSTLQIALFAGLVLGILAGLALATLRANVVARRTLTSPSWELEQPKS